MVGPKSRELVRAILVAVGFGVVAVMAPSAWADDTGGRPVRVPSTFNSPPLDEQPASGSYRKNDHDDWKFTASVNPWFLFLDGDIRVRDTTSSISVNFDNFWKQLHMALMVDLEVQKGDFGLFTDISYAKLWTRDEGTFRTVKNDLDWVLFDFAVYWEALSFEFGSGRLPPRLRLQPYFGGRFQYFGIETDIRGQIINKTLYPVSKVAAPVLGLRGFLDIDEHWILSFAGDGGGWGVDNVNVTWHGELMAGYRFRLKCTDFNLMVGYKGVGYDLEGNDEPIEANIIYHGPVLALGFEF